MDVVDEGTTPIGWASPAARTACRRRRVIGVDVWAERSPGEEQVVPKARSGAMGTHLRLAAALDGGGALGTSWDDEHGDLRLRFVARQDDVHVTDEAICELLAHLSGRLRWSRLVKLEELDGVPAFEPLPSL